jgi:acetyltransferase-like isoleucine patch superfamily enzyme
LRKDIQVVEPHKLSVGRDVFIGVNAIILGGVRVIGIGAVIGAGAVVTKPVPNFEVWAGNPARKIGERG